MTHDNSEMKGSNTSPLNPARQDPTLKQGGKAMNQIKGEIQDVNEGDISMDLDDDDISN